MAMPVLTQYRALKLAWADLTDYEISRVLGLVDDIGLQSLFYICPPGLAQAVQLGRDEWKAERERLLASNTIARIFK